MRHNVRMLLVTRCQATNMCCALLSIMSRRVSRLTPPGPHGLASLTSPHAGLCSCSVQATSGQI
jgi:hypothetical protein